MFTDFDNKMTFTRRLVLTTIVSCALVSVLLCAVATYQSIQGSNETIAQLKKNLFADYDALIKSEVETAVTMLQMIHERQQKGDLKPEQARVLGANLLRGLRYGKEGYFWTDTVEGVNVVHGALKEKIEGRHRINDQDKKGKYLIQEIIANGKKEGGGYTDYYYPKAGSDVPILKRGYSLEFKPWQWVVGTGNYVDDLDVIIEKEKMNRAAATRREVTILALTGIIAALIAVFGAVASFKKTMTQLGGEPAELASIASKIADGNLMIDFSRNGNNTGVYAEMERMTVKLKGLVSDIKKAATSVASGSEQLSANAEQITKTMHEQSTRATQIATSAEEMSQTIVDIAKNSSEISNSAKNTATIAQKGAGIVGQSVGETKAISETVTTSTNVVQALGERSKQIGKIVSVINEIADQTNLLALNAAIEAARAGEQGRGFAVVADEVRKLAERTAQATSEISQMIGSIQGEVDSTVSSMATTNEKVDSGLKFSTEAGVQLETIVTSVNALQNMVQQIASATEEMSTTSEMISGDIQAVANSSQQISGNSEQMARSSSELARLANNLKQTVDHFKV